MHWPALLSRCDAPRWEGEPMRIKRFEDFLRELADFARETYEASAVGLRARPAKKGDPER